MMKSNYSLATYIWIDGCSPSNIRWKTRKVMAGSGTLLEFPEWSFDGSSTGQAPTTDSDLILKPVKAYSSDSTFLQPDEFYVLCEVLYPDGTPHETNHRSKLVNREDLWIGFEQEYTIMKKDGYPLGFDGQYAKEQGLYYCGNNPDGFDFSKRHLKECNHYGINIVGLNAEVLLGQWEYQTFTEGSLSACDDLIMSRFFLEKICREGYIDDRYDLSISLDPKPLTGDWNGSGLHVNFSTELMRNNVRGIKFFEEIYSALSEDHKDYISISGIGNERRLTGKHETSSMDNFTVGRANRSTSIRVPHKTAESWKGYLEDRRPASNADPYLIVASLQNSIETAETRAQFSSVI